MKGTMRVYYDEEGDFLELRVGKPTPSTYDNIGNDIFRRIDDKTKEVRGFAIFNFKKRTEKLKNIDVSLPIELKVSS